MTIALGVICALIAMFGWGVGDFLIQKNSRAIGSWKSLFFISLFGAIILTPFITNELVQILTHPDVILVFLCAASIVLLAAALLEFKSLKEGKLVVVEPLSALEIPVSGMLAFFFLSEAISGMQILLIGLLIVGLILVSIKTDHLKARLWLEKGVLIAALSTLFMGTVNFLFGVGARQTSALMINWFASVFLVVACLVYLFKAKKVKTLFADMKTHSKSLFWMCFADNVAWISFAFAMLLAPISISVALSQSYIIITVLFGIYFNKEQIQTHQKVGLILSIAAAIILAITL